eukprot:602775-Hanusia_phi.AAC.2
MPETNGDSTPCAAATCSVIEESLSSRDTARRSLPGDSRGGESLEKLKRLRDEGDTDNDYFEEFSQRASFFVRPRKSVAARTTRRTLSSEFDVAGEGAGSSGSSGGWSSSCGRWDRGTDGLRLVHILIDPPGDLADFFEEMEGKPGYREVAAMARCKVEYLVEASSMFQDTSWRPKLLIQDELLEDLNATPSRANPTVTPRFLRRKLVEFKSRVGFIGKEHRLKGDADRLWELCMIYHNPPLPDVYYFLRLLDMKEIPKFVSRVFRTPDKQFPFDVLDSNSTITSIYVDDSEESSESGESDMDEADDDFSSEMRLIIEDMRAEISRSAERYEKELMDLMKEHPNLFASR